MQPCFQWFVHNFFAPTAAEVVSNDEDRFLKISVHFQIPYLQNEVGDPHLYNSLVISSRSFIKLSMLEDFRANVLKLKEKTTVTLSRENAASLIHKVSKLMLLSVYPPYLPECKYDAKYSFCVEKQFPQCCNS